MGRRGRGKQRRDSEGRKEEKRNGVGVRFCKSRKVVPREHFPIMPTSASQLLDFAVRRTARPLECASARVAARRLRHSIRRRALDRTRPQNPSAVRRCDDDDDDNNANRRAAGLSRLRHGADP